MSILLVTIGVFAKKIHDSVCVVCSLTSAMALFLRRCAVAAALLALATGVDAAPRLQGNDTAPMRIMDEKPNYPHDPNTISSCTYWWDNDGQIPCADMPGEWGISMENFLRWVSCQFVAPLQIARLTMSEPIHHFILWQLPARTLLLRRGSE